jgi:hypothetical protein
MTMGVLPRVRFIIGFDAGGIKGTPSARRPGPGENHNARHRAVVYDLGKVRDRRGRSDPI